MITLTLLLCLLSRPDDGLTSRFFKWRPRAHVVASCRPEPSIPDADHPRIAPPPR